MPTPARATSASTKLPRPQPCSPDDLEGGSSAASKHAWRKRRYGGSGLGPGAAAAMGLRSAACSAVGVLAGVLLVAAVGYLHTRYVVPQVQQLVELEARRGQEAAEQQRHGVLLQRHSGDLALPGPAAAGGPEPAAAAKHRPGGRAAGAGCSCTVHLHEADAAVLQREIAGMVQALSDEHPWVAALPDAAAPEAARDVVARGQQVVVAGVAPPRLVDEAFGPKHAQNIPGALHCAGRWGGAGPPAVLHTRRCMRVPLSLPALAVPPSLPAAAPLLTVAAHCPALPPCLPQAWRTCMLS